MSLQFYHNSDTRVIPVNPFLKYEEPKRLMKMDAETESYIGSMFVFHFDVLRGGRVDLLDDSRRYTIIYNN